MDATNVNLTERSVPSINSGLEFPGTAPEECVTCPPLSREDNSSLLTHLPEPEAPMADTNEAYWKELLMQEQNRLLNTPIVEMVRIHEPLQLLYEHMSIEDKWEQWAGYLGLTPQDVEVKRSIIRNRRDMPGKTFTILYMNETKCGLGFFLKSLIELSEGIKDTYCMQLANKIWQDAWLRNANWPNSSEHKMT